MECNRESKRRQKRSKNEITIVELMVFSNINTTFGTFGLLSFALYALLSFFVVFGIHSHSLSCCTDLFFVVANERYWLCVRERESDGVEWVHRKDTHMNRMLYCLYGLFECFLLFWLLLVWEENVRCFIGHCKFSVFYFTHKYSLLFRLIDVKWIQIDPIRHIEQQWKNQMYHQIVASISTVIHKYTHNNNNITNERNLTKMMILKYIVKY